MRLARRRFLLAALAPTLSHLGSHSRAAPVSGIKSIEDYGASKANSAAVNTPKIQIAISANYGKSLLIPRGTFLVATAGQTDASVGPVGDALTITDAITLVFEGTIQGTNNCNVIHIKAGSQDVATLASEGGGIRGPHRLWNPKYAQFNKNGALLKVTSGNLRAQQIKLIDPVQYALYSDGADEGHLNGVELIGGWSSYDAKRVTGPNDNNFGIALFNGSNSWRIEGLKTIANAAGGKCSQAIGSDAATGLGVANNTIIRGCRFHNQHEKAIYLFGEGSQILNNHAARGLGDAIRTIGARATVTDNVVESFDGGGITLYDGARSVCANNRLSDILGAGMVLAYYTDEVIGSASLSNAVLQGNVIDMRTRSVDGLMLAGIDVRIGILVSRGRNAASQESGISVLENTVRNANYSISDPRAAIDFSAFHPSSVYKELQVERNTIDKCGAHGIRFGAASYQQCGLRDNRVRDVGQVTGKSVEYHWSAGAITR